MSKRNILVLILFLLVLAVHGQPNKYAWNKPNYDNYPFHFGFAIGLNTLDFRMVHSPGLLQELDTVMGVNNIRQPGFNIHMVGNLRLGEYFDLRFIPGLIFGQRDLKYFRRIGNLRNEDTEIEYDYHRMQIESTFLTFPLYLKLRSKRLNNWRPYFLIGGNYCYDLESEKKIKEEEKPKIRLNRHDFYIEFGGGVDYYFPFFKLATELRFSIGLKDIVRRDDSEYTAAFEELNSKMVSLVIFVE